MTIFRAGDGWLGPENQLLAQAYDAPGGTHTLQFKSRRESSHMCSHGHSVLAKREGIMRLPGTQTRHSASAGLM